VPINDLIAMVKEMTATGARWSATSAGPTGSPALPGHFPGDGEFGFTAQTSFEEGLRRTIAWYEEARRSRPGTCNRDVAATYNWGRSTSRLYDPPNPVA